MSEPEHIDDLDAWLKREQDEVAGQEPATAEFDDRPDPTAEQLAIWKALNILGGFWL